MTRPVPVLSVITIDRAASTVEIVGRSFPAAALICPPEPDGMDRGEHDRALAAGGGDQSVYVPAENGLLLRVEEGRNEHHHGLSLDLNARTCQLVWSVDEWLYLPWNVAFAADGSLVHGGTNCWSWCEPWWVVEMIDLLSCKPFTQPGGLPVRIVPLDYFTETADG